MDPKTEKIERQVKKLVSGYLDTHDYESNHWHLEPISTDGSIRLFWRVKGLVAEKGLVAMANPPVEAFLRQENQAYLFIGRHLQQRGISVPQIYAHNLVRGFFLMEDLGEQSLQSLVRAQTDPIAQYEKVLDQMLRLHTEGPKGFDPQWCCQTPAYDKYVIRTLESDYFRKAFLVGYLGLRRDWASLNKDLDYLADKVSSCRADSLIHRDFQSRNIMVRENGVGVLDWQGARLGPPAYDLASLVIDPYVDLDWATREALSRRYIEAIAPFSPQWAEDLKRYFWYVAIQRNLQILGAFGFLTKKRQKGTFEQYIPAAVLALRRLLVRVQDKSLENLRSVAHELQERIGKH